MSAPDSAEAPAELGLRERKRRATRRAIELAAITIVRDHGLDAATVDEIARVADVSPRTFFNYFSSKEAAIAGDGPELPDAEAQDAFVADRSPILSGIAALFATMITPVLHDHEIVRLRRVIAKDNPHIAGRRWASIHRFEHELTDLVARRLVDEDRSLANDPAAVQSRARLISFIAISAFRHAWLDWMDNSADGSGVIEHLDASFAMVPVVVAQTTPR